MDAKQDILEKTATYIGETQILIDKQAEDRVTFIKRASQAAGVLVHKGIIERDRVDAFLDKISEDESGSVVWDLVEKLAGFIEVDSLGEAAQEKLAMAGSELDPYERLYHYGDARADVSVSGIIE